ncbi:MAG: MATE family efflux transporter [Candidatus Faecivicinus sp.]|nr:MATE family efflux transporter [Candidatus Faecivicinus sp.]
MQKNTLEKKSKRYDVDMTEGSAFRHLLNFAIPLLFGNLFQQMYNMVDSWVVGNYVGKQAFAAVGTVGPIVNMLIGFFSGLASGASVVIAQFYGAKKPEKVRQAVQMAILITLVLTVLFTAIGVSMTPMMLRLMKTTDEVFPEAVSYLTIYFSGMIGLLFYNMCSGILRAVGDSKRPFYYLVVAAVVNTVLDLVFVIYFDMGVAGVAYATIIAQAASAALTLITLIHTDSCVKLMAHNFHLHWDVMAKIFTIGLPAALQMAVTAFSNVFVQSYINFFGTECMGGWTAYNKIDQLIFLPMQSLALAITTYVGQNLGRGRAENAKKGVHTALAMSMTVTVVISAAVIAFAPYLVEFFNDSEGVVQFGTMFLKWLTPFYTLCCINQIYTGALRGAGDSRSPMFIMLGSFVVFRQIYLFVMSHVANEIIPIAMSYPAGWILCSVLTLIYYRKRHLARLELA